MNIKHAFGAIAVVALLGTAACSGTSTQESTGQYVDSAVLATKVRAAIAKDPVVSIIPVDVSTFRDTVQLSGFVDSQATKDRAGQIARSVDGVGKVENNIVVKTN